MDLTSARARTVLDLHELVLSTADIAEFAEGVVRAAERHVTGGTHAAVTLKRRGVVAGVASSNPRAAACDEVEYGAGEGPCLSSIEESRRVLVSDIAAEVRWPAWCEAARAAGFRSAVALSRKVPGGVEFALNLYSTDVDAWDANALLRAEMYTEELARTLTLALRSANQAHTIEDLRASLASRAVIDQAMGVIMSENRCTAEEAFRILCSASQHRNIKVRDIATALITRVTGAAPTAPIVTMGSRSEGERT
ncbi:GAF and ANTAR domain-containing protein [Cellulomonas sp. 179-A 4D5 NHS]|uniref:GAF and ANTAR domain-containing protein n=1 Tax=Cellulomonas sp. 179-A 4D5 NHS TaxID=3142378 RepID=UPI00399F4D95